MLEAPRDPRTAAPTSDAMRRTDQKKARESPRQRRSIPPAVVPSRSALRSSRKWRSPRAQATRQSTAVGLPGRDERASVRETPQARATPDGQRDPETGERNEPRWLTQHHAPRRAT